MAGRLGKTQLLSVASSIGVCVPMDTISGIIDVYGDVHANPADDTDTSGTCDAISFGTSFTGVRGDIAGQLAGEGLCLVDSCYSATYDRCVASCSGQFDVHFRLRDAAGFVSHEARLGQRSVRQLDDARPRRARR